MSAVLASERSQYAGLRHAEITDQRQIWRRNAQEKAGIIKIAVRLFLNGPLRRAQVSRRAPTIT